MMSRLKLAVATRCFGMPMKRAIKFAAKIGARGVQLDAQNEVSPTSFGASGDRHFRKYLEEFNLSVASLRLPSRHALTEPDFLDQRVASIKSALEFAWRLQGPLLIIHPGTIHKGEDGNFENVCEVLNDLARFASHIGTELCIACENNSPTLIRELISEVRSGQIGVELDTAEMIFNQHDPESTIRELHNEIKTYRLRDAIREMDKGGSEVPLGQGMVMWDQVLPLISETGYRGWLTVDRTQGDQRLEDCQHAITYLESVLI
ncbi:MAG: sugar phosphate isomerase/epimerase family protein [Gimesia sp.]